MTKSTAGLLAIGALVLAALTRPPAPPRAALDPQVRAEINRRLDNAVQGPAATAVRPTPAELAPVASGPRASLNRP